MENKLDMGTNTYHPGDSRKGEIEGSQSRLVWAKSESLSLK
jgi:hypothetical protein